MVFRSKMSAILLVSHCNDSPLIIYYLRLAYTGAVSLVGTPDYSAPEVLRTGVFRIENEDRIRKGKKAKTPSKEKGEVG